MKPSSVVFDVMFFDELLSSTMLVGYPSPFEGILQASPLFSLAYKVVVAAKYSF
jgi:hypothetical protein